MFEGVDPVVLARVQFAFTMAFHILFPALSIGLGSYLAVLEGLWLLTGREAYMRLFRYWVRVFAIAFGMGVVSGIVMSYQFGTNWSGFSDKAGPVVGPLMGYEVLTAFFMEAGFLGIMLFGIGRVPKLVHFLATLLVAAGALVSAFWILVVNSWMQTPQGYSVNEVGQFVPEDWLAIIFNPSLPYRLAHMVIAAYLATAFVVGAVGAFHLLRKRAGPEVRIMFSMAMWMATLVTPVQIAVGDLHGLNTLAHQPAKIAAMEGHFEPELSGAPLYLFGWPDAEAETTRYAVGVPNLGSLILTHEWDGTLKGLKSWPKEDWPNLPYVFWGFRIMVGLGLLMLATGIASLYLRWQHKLYAAPLFQRWVLVMGPSGLAAIIAGWVTTEVGRQPYTVYGLLRTADSASPVAAPALGGSLAAFVVVYFAVFGAGIWYLFRMFGRPPEAATEDELRGGPERAAGITPIQAVHGPGQG
ncbi:cytochrome ubiquinol oxidase subunit I [Propylenella binzhouense]|uniref:Cytochrome ubiquinol oxidase subunit I n=1 Tax=Propylenella binzhouense TaxID=2555902 RepID=A0A964T742_9HYPH|nr:cytochrome ubiquinol oxidase subunit I [Propylenella binzhouense]MYZ49733.1 cytochrome ubiquinol oxidase subunit I [Propylenella binzhouense]